MPQSLNEKLRDWGRQVDLDPELIDIESRIRFLQTMLFDEFEPTRTPPHKTFNDRLEDWVNNAASDADQQTLLRAVLRIFFAGSKDMEALLVSAFRQHVVQWIVSTRNLALTSPTLNEEIEREVRSVWFTALTDSAPLTRFYHVNNVEGVDWRPDWRGLVHAQTDPQVIAHRMAQNGLSSIVVIEDFVGSGTQLLESITPAFTLPAAPPILFCPLIICPAGAEVAERIAAVEPRFQFSPVLRLSRDSFVHDAADPHESQLISALRELIVRLNAKVQGTNPKHNYGPFGFAQPNQPVMGGLVVMHTNCPDNTIPAIHRTSDGPWAALFPRSARN
ncbi:phosphoribosyltransferase-like protein [Paraburkholderia sp. DD10]|uniref:phosphoribosyltransferase-like protein n=1 Tax=Paraburkholderia sp. DD10 TaxID=3409691 RepID=UPI003BA3635B